MRSHSIRRSRLRSILTAFAVFVSSASWAVASPTYSITDLGTLSGTTQSIATGINSQGQVVGVSYTTNDPINGYDAGAKSFLYSNGQTTQISPLGGPATAINDSGQVVGGNYKDINNAGQYVGTNNGGYAQLYSYSGGQPTNLPLLGAAINDSGTIVGSIFVPGFGGGDTGHAAVYSNGQVTDLNGAIGGDRSTALGINNNGDVLISGFLGNQGHSVLFANGTYLDLNNLSGGSGMNATALNDRDQVVGNNFLYSGDQFSALTSLIPASSGWSQLNATKINDAGQIIGQGLINGQEQAFLMTPTVQPVPEPSSLAVFGGLMASLGLIRIAKHRSRGVKGQKGKFCVNDYIFIKIEFLIFPL